MNAKRRFLVITAVASLLAITSVLTGDQDVEKSAILILGMSLYHVFFERDQ